MILLVATTWATTLVVGTDTATIGEAITAAVDGDLIQIPAGTWYECLDTGGKSITLQGDGATIDATGLCDNLLRVASGETVTVSGLTLVNGTGRAVDVEWSTLTLDGVTVRNTGRTDWSGGGLWTYGAALTTTHCTFVDNVAAEGAAIYHYAYTTWNDTGSTYTDNVVGGSGGAVMAYYDNALSVTDATFEANSAGYYGGAIATWNYTDLTVSGSTFTANTAPTTGGGAIFFYPTDTNYGVFDLSASTFTTNSAVDGGALWIGWANTSVLRDNAFRANLATNSGGAVFAYVAYSVSLQHDLFCGNTAQWGGAANVQWTTVDAWTANRFVENTATQGAGAYRYASYAGSMTQNSFVGNAATDLGGGYFATWAYADFRNNIVADTPSGTGIYTGEAQTQAASPVEYDGWAGNAVVDASGYFFVDDGTDGNVVAADPGFVAWSRDGDCDNDDLRLLGTSPFKDAGDPALADLDGSRSDMGAYGGADQPVVDLDADGYPTDTDCDDTDPASNPAAAETCNSVDDDCDGAIDDDATDATVWYVDADGDGFGDPGTPVTGCDPPDGTVDNADDCDDGDPWVSPAASDYPDDGIDADCSGADNTQVIPDAPAGDDKDPADTPPDGCGCQTGDTSGAWLGLVAVMLLQLRKRP